MKNVIYLFAIGTIAIFSACVSKECQFPAAYEFEIPASLLPANDTFKIGDTISITSNFPDQVYERKTDRRYFLENFRFYPEMRITEISTSTPNEAGVLKFDVIIDSISDFYQFNYSDGAISYIGDYSSDSENYFLEYKIIAKEAGLFVFTHFSELGYLGKDQEFEGMCRNKEVSAIVNMNEGSDNNIDLLRESPNTSYSETVFENPERRFHQYGGFAFVVVE